MEDKENMKKIFVNAKKVLEIIRQQEEKKSPKKDEENER